MFDKLYIYGFNTEPADKIMTKTFANANSDIMLEMDVATVYAQPKVDISNEEFITGKKRGYYKQTVTFSCKSYNMFLPDSNYNVKTFYNTDVLSYAYHYIAFDNYKVLPVGMTLNDAINVIITNFSIEENDTRFGTAKRIEYRFEVVK